jgi:hypothetical protein
VILLLVAVGELVARKLVASSKRAIEVQAKCKDTLLAGLAVGSIYFGKELVLFVVGLASYIPQRA